MGLVITNNVTSLIGQHNLKRTNSALQRSLERLSSGLRINRGADGPAALVVSEQQRAQIVGLQTAIENASKAVSLVQTAEGALDEINRLLLKARSLALDSANAGVHDADALAANQAEINNILATIDRIAANTQFGTKKLLDGSAGISGSVSDPARTVFLRGTSDTLAGTYTVNVTTAAQRAYIISTTALADNDTISNDEVLTVNGVNITLTAGMTRAQIISRINSYTNQTGVEAVDDDNNDRIVLRTLQFGSAASISVVSTRQGAGSAGFTTTIQTDTGVDIAGTIGGQAAVGSGNVLTAVSGAPKGLSVAVKTDTAATNLVGNTFSGNVGTVTVTDNSLQFQIGPNAGQTAKVAIGNMATSALGLNVAGVQFSSLSQINVRTVSGATDAIKVIDQAIDDVTNLRGMLGAFQQNTLEATANNLRATLENTVAAESTIRDTDYAQEIANFTKQQILLQTGISVLANANQVPQLVLALLQR
ncbi:MAG: flagellin [Gemmatales bacterium]|nr:flagellin [Gemmatales bacterium]